MKNPSPQICILGVLWSSSLIQSAIWHNLFKSWLFLQYQLIFYYIRRKKNEFQCSSIGGGNWSLIKNIFLVFSSSSSIFFQKISSNRRTHYGNTGYGVSKSGYTQLESFLPKNEIPNGNYWILRIGVVASVKNWASF